MNKRFRAKIEKCFAGNEISVIDHVGEITIETSVEHLYQPLKSLRDDPSLRFDVLIDICGVDYSDYGLAEWETNEASFQGFSRGVEQVSTDDKPLKLAVVYHLLSTEFNERLRVKACCDATMPVVPSVCQIWPAANWFEREAYDLYGILFDGHEDLRRILTDYGFIGHPFRKDFPLSGHVEMRYDAATSRVVYEPVDIEPRVLVPKVIRDDSRASQAEGAE